MERRIIVFLFIATTLLVNQGCATGVGCAAGAGTGAVLTGVMLAEGDSGGIAPATIPAALLFGAATGAVSGCVAGLFAGMRATNIERARAEPRVPPASSGAATLDAPQAPAPVDPSTTSQ